MPYFDHNATTPLCPAAREAWLGVQDRLWHNASSLYREAAAARDELEQCRERLADLTGTADPERIVFTGGATEACNAFFRGCREANERASDGAWRVVISPYEHPAVREPAGRWCGAGRVDADELAAAAATGARTVAAWMAANNETGETWAMPPWGNPDGAARPAVHFCDASQWLGKLPADVFGTPGMAEAFVVGCAHKLGGPKGVGFMRLGDCADLASGDAWQLGGPQEHGRRAGTEDVAGVAAMVAALEWCEDHMPGDPAPRDEFEHDLGWPVVAADRPRLWNTSMIVVPRHQNKLWLARLSHRGFQCSTGSACSSGTDGDSLVLAALGLSPDERRRVLRFSAGWSTTRADWQALRAALGEVMAELERR